MTAIRFLAAGGALVLAASTAPSQISRNVELLGTLDPASSGSDYNDIWGYRNPANGKEYALLMSEDGTHVIDCTDPRNPVQRGMIRSENRFSSGNIWRDAKTYGHYAYVVSEAYGGIQIIDLADPDNPVRVKHWGSTMWDNTHNIGLDEGTGLLYAFGTDVGTHIIDVKTDPVNPQRIYQLGSPYIHDGSIRNGFAYLADQNGNRLRIYDVTQLPGALPLLSQVGLPGSSIAHATWPTRDGAVCVTANESSGGPVGIFDVLNKRLPQQIATYRANPSTAPSAIPHNVYVEDRILHVSHYTEGYRVVDLSDPFNPTEVGYYDTYGGSSSGYNGAWGAYHLMPSGTIYISDIQSGLFVFKPKATAVRYGTATAGSSGVAPTIHTFGSAYLGNSRFRVDVENTAPSRPGAFFLGLGRGNTSVFGINLYIALSPPPIVINVATTAESGARVPISIPNVGALAGVVLDAQFVLLDSATPGDFAATQGLEFELFQL